MAKMFQDQGGGTNKSRFSFQLDFMSVWAQ